MSDTRGRGGFMGRGRGGSGGNRGGRGFSRGGGRGSDFGGRGGLRGGGRGNFAPRGGFGGRGGQRGGGLTRGGGGAPAFSRGRGGGQGGPRGRGGYSAGRGRGRGRGRDGDRGSFNKRRREDRDEANDSANSEAGEGENEKTLASTIIKKSKKPTMDELRAMAEFQIDDDTDSSVGSGSDVDDDEDGVKDGVYSDDDEEDEEDREINLGESPWYFIFSLFAEEDPSPEQIEQFEKQAQEGKIPDFVEEFISVEQLRVLALAYLDAQLLAGGFAQFIYNCKGERIALAFTLHALENVIEAPRHSELLSKSVEIFNTLSEKEQKEYIDGDFFETPELRKKLDEHTAAAKALRPPEDESDVEEEEGDQEREGLSAKIVEVAKALGFTSAFDEDDDEEDDEEAESMEDEEEEMEEEEEVSEEE